MKDPYCNIRSDQGRPSYVWWRVGISDGGQVIGRAKMEGRNSYGGFSIGSTESRQYSRRVSEPVERCCSCIWHSACFTTGLSARACKFRNAGRQCTGCYCWGRCKNRGRLMPSPTTARGLLGHLPRGTDPPATKQCSSPLPRCISPLRRP